MTSDRVAFSLPEYDDNPFIAKLPPIMGQKDLYKSLVSAPIFRESEPGFPAHLRKHCIARLSKCFLPLARQVELADRFGMLLRQGYLGRNPLTHDYLHHLHNGIERIEAGSLEVPVSQPVQNTANSFALLGCPGVGKTVAMNRVLAQYPQVIQHDAPFSLTQVVWLRLEAPALGSLRNLCIDFFHTVDRLIHTDYVKRYATKTTVEQMVAYMAHVANLHALGVLVIDEIQHLRGAKVGAAALMKFLVRLVNTIGVPVIPIGTLSALPILQGSFSQARRNTGLGSMLWDRMDPGATWNSFLEQLWGYQWTNPRTTLTDELNAAIYDESQGVADLAVKLVMLAQMRLVGISEMRKGQSEKITTELIRVVAKEELAMVAPMITALRENDTVKAAKFDDLRSLNEHVGLVLSRAIGGGRAQDSVEAPPPAATAAAPASACMEAVLLTSLTEMGVAEDVAKALVAEAVANNPSGDPLTLMQTITATLKASPPVVKPPKPKKVPVDELPDEDLRRIVANGKQAGAAAYDALLAAGVVRPPMLDFAA